MAKAAKKASGAKPVVTEWKLNKTVEEHARDGQAAWKLLQEGKGDQWPLWSRLCPILKDCRDKAMKDAGLDVDDETPTKDGKYNAAMTRNLVAVGLHKVPKMARKACIDAAPYLKRHKGMVTIDEYREELKNSDDPKDQWKYLNQQSPQAVWREYAKYYELLPEKDEVEKKFEDMKVKDVLRSMENPEIASRLSRLIGDNRTTDLSGSMLEKVFPPKRPAPVNTIDIPTEAKSDAVLHLIEKLKWDTSEKSRLTDALGFGADDASQKVIDGLREQITALEARPPGDTEQVASLRQELEQEREQIATLSAQLAKASTPTDTDAAKELERLRTLVIPQLEARLAAALAEPPAADEGELAMLKKQMELLQAENKRLAEAGAGGEPDAAMANLKEQVERLTAQARDQQDRVQQAANEVREAKAEAETAKATVGELTKDASRKTARLDAAVKERDEAQAARSALTVEVEALRKQLEAAQQPPAAPKGNGQAVDGEGGEC